MRIIAPSTEASTSFIGAGEGAVSPTTASEHAARRSTAAWWIFLLVAAALLPIMIWASFDFGVTWDEKARHRYGELIWEFLRGLRDRSTFVAEDGGNFYGGLFDTLCAAIERFVPLNRYVLRHIINATFGWAGIVYCGRLARRLFGDWAGIAALILLVMSPRYFAESMNNPKDLPFAATTMAALYYFSTVSPKWPYISARTAIKIVLALGLALNIRAAALLYLGYLGLLVATYIVLERSITWRRLADTAGRLLAITVGVLLVGTIFWPWAQLSPLTRPIEALFAFSNFDYVSGMLFGGRVVISSDLPWYYAPWWFLISTPPVVLVGILLSVVHTRTSSSWGRFALWAAALFPVVLVILQHSTLYDGVRHLLFIYPIFVALAAAGWALWLSKDNAPRVRGLAAALLIVGLINVLVFDVRSHPNEGVYFNELVGGPRGAFGRYEMDYWGNCLLEAVSWSATTARLSRFPVTISGEPWHIIQLDSERFPQLYFTPPNRLQHHLDVRLARGSEDVIEGLVNRPDVLYRVKTGDGAVLCIVAPGPRFPELQPHLKLPPGR